MSGPGQHDPVLAEFDRLHLAREDMPFAGLAFDSPEAAEQFLAHLRSLAPGATWYDVFPDLSEDDDLVDDEDPYTDRGYPLGGFDYPNAPRGSAVFASANSTDDIAAAAEAMERAVQLHPPVYGAGLVLDRGHPHLFIVLPLGAPDEQAWQIADFLREQPGIGNAFPERLESARPRDA